MTENHRIIRRDFLRTAGATAVAVSNSAKLKELQDACNAWDANSISPKWLDVRGSKGE